VPFSAFIPWLARPKTLRSCVAAAAKCDVGRAIKEDHFSNINTIRNLTLFEYQHRPHA
jgi:hypothetical protein